jgi:glycosyltransferase involved in cell wall biosynthesis
MRLVFISSSFPPYTSGVGVNAATITSGLARKGHRVNVFIPDYNLSDVKSSPLVSPELEFTLLSSITNPFKKSHRLFLPNHKLLIRNLKLFSPDIVHLQEPQFHIFAAVSQYCRAYRIPLVCAHHFPPEFVTNQLPKPLRFQSLNDLIIYSVVSLYNQSQHVITPTYAMARLLKDHGLKIPVSVISNGVDTKRFAPQGHAGMQQIASQPDAGIRQTAKSAFANAEWPKILYLGRVDFDKNLDTLIYAAKYIKEPCEIRFAGGGKAKSYLVKLTSKLDLNNQIKYLGYIPESEKPDVYRKASIFVMPSTAEAQSIVSLEAAASGLPLVLADAAALPELIDKKNPNGYLFRPQNPRDLAEKINQLLSNPGWSEVMGQNSRALALTHDIRIVINAYEKTYLDLIS